MSRVQSQPIEWHKLLGREPVRLDPSRFRHLEGAAVLITGAGGSIGSALTWGVLNCGAAKVILLDSSEQALHRLSLDVHESKMGKCAWPVLGSVLDNRLLDETFEQFRPDIVFHAAAFKHLPLLESQPFAAIENNTVGTYGVSRAAEKFRARVFVGVSTDKAVNPTSLMGASKHLAELIVGSVSSSHSKFTTVRLGNVLGSDGSVAPRFVEQIESGGPVTITDVKAARFFFTIEETIDLILTASAMEAENAIVTPLRGEATEVVALAKFLIRELGGEGINFKYTGLRPGEKLTEELCSNEESKDAKERCGCRVILKQPKSPNPESMISDLRLAVRDRNVDLLINTIRRYVPAYQPSTTLRRLTSAPGASSQ